MPTDRETELKVTVALLGLNSVLQAPQGGSVTERGPESPEHPVYIKCVLNCRYSQYRKSISKSHYMCALQFSS